jgi:hypothetical protein
VHSFGSQKHNPDAINWPLVWMLATLAVVVLVVKSVRLRHAATAPDNALTAIRIVSSWSPLP